ncbi:MAG: hypothetical protein PHR09_04065 [Bacilli bacterium]|nr:hypothetical protein [Bacilli bacterium]
MVINNKEEFEDIVSKYTFRYAKTYSNRAPHEYVIVEYTSEYLDEIRALNRYIEEHYDEIEIFWNKEYKVIFVNNHKYWSVEDYNITNILNRNWDYKNEDGTTNKSITESYRGK